MIEKKCKICGEWVNSKKIAMHYWNIHKKKYSDYKDNEETRTVENQGETNEKKTNETTKTNPATEVKVEPVKVEVPIQVEQVQEPEPIQKFEEPVAVTAPIFETETVDEGLVPTPEPSKINEATMWKETAHLFDTPVTNETRNELRKVERPNLYEENNTMNEWCN